MWLCLVFTVLAIWIFIPQARYNIKFFIFSFGSALIVIPCAPGMLLRPRHYGNSKWPAYFIEKLARLLGVYYEIRGEENLNRHEGGVVVVNHQSALDLAFVSFIWPYLEPWTCVVKKAILFLFPFGPIAWLWGTIFIDRRKGASALHQIEKESQAIKRDRAKIGFFPEGTRSMKEHLLPFKKGAFHVAIATQSSITPIVISKYYFVDAERKVFGRGRVICSVLPEIPTKGMTAEKDVNHLMDKTRALMDDEFQKLNAEVLNSRKFD